MKKMNNTDNRSLKIFRHRTITPTATCGSLQNTWIVNKYECKNKKV